MHSPNLLLDDLWPGQIWWHVYLTFYSDSSFAEKPKWKLSLISFLLVSQTQEDTCSSTRCVCVCVCSEVGGESWSVQVGNLSSVIHPQLWARPIVPLCGPLCVEPLWGAGAGHCCVWGFSAQTKSPSMSLHPAQTTGWLTDWLTAWLTDWLDVWPTAWLVLTEGWLGVCLLGWLIGWRQKRW